MLKPSAVLIMRSLLKPLVRRSYRYTLWFIKSRGEFPHILNARGLLGEGAEIGVQKGYFSNSILTNWHGRKLYSIDPWKEFDETYIDLANVGIEVHEDNYLETLERLAPFGDRSCVMRLTSMEASAQFQNDQLDFVYIDAQHHYEAVREDIALWYPKVKPGGILAGHDYLDGMRRHGIFGVKSAVDQFVKTMKLRLHLSHESRWRSWLIVKPHARR